MAIEIVDLPIYPLIAWWFSIVFSMFTRGFYVYFQYSTQERLSSWKPIRVQPSVNPSSRPTPDCQRPKHHCLVVEPPLWKIESVGMMTFPMYGKIKNVWNHQSHQNICELHTFYDTRPFAKKINRCESAWLNLDPSPNPSLFAARNAQGFGHGSPMATAGALSWSLRRPDCSPGPRS